MEPREHQVSKVCQGSRAQLDPQDPQVLKVIRVTMGLLDLLDLKDRKVQLVLQDPREQVVQWVSLELEVLRDQQDSLELSAPLDLMVRQGIRDLLVFRDYLVLKDNQDRRDLQVY